MFACYDWYAEVDKAFCCADFAPGQRPFCNKLAVPNFILQAMCTLTNSGVHVTFDKNVQYCMQGNASNSQYVCIMQHEQEDKQTEDRQMHALFSERRVAHAAKEGGTAAAP